LKLAALTDEKKALTKKSVVRDPLKSVPFITAPPSAAAVSDEQSGSDKEVILNPHSSVFVPTSIKVDVTTAPAADKYVSELAVQDQYNQLELIKAIRLPTTQLVAFDGDPLKFLTFMRSFENLLEDCTNDDAARLMRLVAYCTGKARNVIECCTVMNPVNGYARAKTLLKQRFGNDYLIAEVWIKKIICGKPIGVNDKERSKDLADDLSSCTETLTAMNYNSELNNQSTLLKIAEQLPTYLQARVKRDLCRIREKGELPGIRELARLFRETANEANDTVYGRLAVTRCKLP
jgi:hypothetical protein